MKMLWKILSWIAIACGLIAYFIGVSALATKTTIWNIPTEFWFYDAIAAGIFGLFFLIYAVHSDETRRR